MAVAKKISKSTKRRLRIFGILSIVCIFYFLFCLGYEIYQVRKLESEKIELKQKYNELKDPEYVAKYARENYSYSKEGEYIIKLKEENKKIDKVNNQINTNYIVIGLSAFITLIFLILIFKSRKKNK